MFAIECAVVLNDDGKHSGDCILVGNSNDRFSLAFYQDPHHSKDWNFCNHS